MNQRKFTDMTGKTFGRLTVLSLSHHAKRRGYMWECQCECGNVKQYSTSALNRGKALSCGCLLEEKQNQNLIGLTFGHLTVTALHPDRGPQRQKQWECTCSCGSIRIAQTGELNAGRAVSCGCARPRKGLRCGELWSSHWNRYVYGAQQRGFEFSISMQEGWDLFLQQNRQCALSGVEIKFGKRYTADEDTASLDRIDSSKGYVLSNVQWVHKRINIMKLNDSQEEFINWCTLVAKHKGV